ncbi:hypothetical protein JKF63_07444 [Porcisia hertigi]|uniref:Uncharacterized protein n=1 Tax=Porcisia hertigi TaxID=2761500 RepID=A0A836LKW9_9TRYP|nr:hypothetical protein JKF63_07444 [Porcisia hertigi]
MDNKKETWANAHSQLWTSPIKRSVGSRTQSETSSIASSNRDRSLLEDADRHHQLPRNTYLQESRPQIYQPKDKTLLQVSDILEGYGSIACDADIPAVLLHVVKELERAKREIGFKDLLLREYADTVRRRFGLYGEESPPTVAEVSARLRDGTPARPAVSPNPPWLEEPLKELWCTIRNTMQTCFDKNVAISTPILLPDARKSKANVSQLLHSSCDGLSELAREYATAKGVVMQKMESAIVDKQSCRQLTLSAALAELDAYQELNENALKEDGPSGLTGSHTIGGALQSVIDAIPASLQIHFDLQVPEAPVLSRCKNLTELMRFLLSEYLSMERYMEMVEAERQKLADVFSLPSLSKAEANDASGGLQLDEALSRSLQSLQETVASVVTFPHHISEEEIALRRSSMQAIEELAQLLVDPCRGSSAAGSSVPHSVATVRVEPPTRNLMEMVELVKSRFVTMMTQQQRKELAGAQGRAGLAHMEESMTKHGKQVVQLLRDLCASQEDDTPASEASEQLLVEGLCNLDLGRNITPAKLDNFLGDVVERLRMVKTKYQRALHAAAAARARAEAASHKTTGLQKRLQKVAAVVEHIGRHHLGLHFPFTPVANSTASPGEADDVGKGRDETQGIARGDGVSILRRLNLRPALEPTTVTKTSSVTTAKDGPANETATSSAVVTENNVLEALQFIASRIGASSEIRDMAAVQDELAQLHAGEARWKADTSVFHEAMAMLMQRLATNGQMVKQTLFLLGTDESAKDELVEEVLRRGGEEQLESLSADTVYVERTLAELLQKYNRWAQRLQQTIEDHLYTQRKIVKYFAAVCRFFASSQSCTAAAPPDDIPDDNLYDIDSCLMRAADVILPALDAAIQTASQDPRPPSSMPGPEAPAHLPPMAPSSGDTGTKSMTSRQETLAHLARDSAASCTGGVLPYDHRIARLYEMVARLYTTVTSLLQVHYLCIPSATRRRSSGEAELVFDGDADDDGFVDIDLDRLVRVSQQQQQGAATGASAVVTRRDDVALDRFSREDRREDDSGGKVAPTPPNTIAANNDVILRVTYQNMEVVQDTLKRFSANHKMAAILLQKDVDTLQNLLVGMLDKYNEVDVKGTFGQSRETGHELYTMLRDRGQRQKGCYFFNRIGGEGSCTWVTALQQLADGFGRVVDRFGQRTTRATEYHRLVDEVADICTTYMNWAEHCTLPASHALPPELLALSVRNGCEGTAKPAVETAAADSQRNRLGEDVGTSARPVTGSTPTTTTKVTTAAAQRHPKPSRMPPLSPRAPNKVQQQSGQEEAAAAVPTAVSAPDVKISCFTDDGVVRKVLEHMFRLAQLAVETLTSTGVTKAGDDAAVSNADAEVHKLTEETQLLRETVAIAERRVEELTDAQHALERERDQAQSEAAVARAELRRWKRQERLKQEQRKNGSMPVTEDCAPVHPSPRSPRATSSTQQPEKTALTADGADAVIDEATVKKVMEYMRVLSEELQMAKQRANSSNHVTANNFVRSPYQTPASLKWCGAEPMNYADVVQGGLCKEEDIVVDDIDGGRNSHLGVPHSHHHHRSLTKLAEQLRNQYDATEIAPMVVIDPQTHSYSNHQQRSAHARHGRGVASQVRSRYSPVKYRSPAYDACDRYYARVLAPAAMVKNKDAKLSGSMAAYTSQHHLPQEPYSKLDANHLGSCGNSAATASHRRYPRRSLSRDEPLLPPRTAAASESVASPHIYHALQRATPVAAVTASSPRLSPQLAAPDTRPHSSSSTFPSSSSMGAHVHHHRSHYDNDGNRARSTNSNEVGDTDDEREVYRDAGTTRSHTRQRRSRSPWVTAQSHRKPSTPRVSPTVSHFASGVSPSPATVALSAKRERFGSDCEQFTTAAIHPQICRPVALDGQCKSPENVGESLAAAVQQIDAATQRAIPTPTRRSTQAGSGRDAHRLRFAKAPSASPPGSPGSADQQMSRNANLRAAALRRLAEVVSKTAVSSTRPGRI